MVFKDSEESVETNINARRLNHFGFERFYLDPASLNLGCDIAITE
jgi:hypothetical protein